MKKLIITLTGILAFAVVNAQSLDEIVKNYSSAIKQDKLSKVSSIKISGKMSTMGMEMPMVMMMKNPNKIKVTYSFNGQEMVSLFDGEKGYMINPMMGSTEPIELTGDQLQQVKDNNVFSNQIENYQKSGKLTLEGEENVKGKPAFKLKINSETQPVYMFLDKSTYMLVKSTTSVEQMGTPMDVETYFSDYFDTDGVVLPKTTTAMANGMEAAVISFDKVEVNLPMDDGLFKAK